LVGGVGNDTYYIDLNTDIVRENAGEGIDTVYANYDYTLGGNIENLVLTGRALSGTGDANNNQIEGNALSNVLNGGAGADTLIGGAGHDTYYIDSTGDVVVERLDEGFDTIYASFNYTLIDDIECLVLTGSALVGNGNTLSNRITGNGYTNTLTGGYGDDTLIGGGGTGDSLVGGVGDDVYEANASAKILEQPAEGFDTVRLLDYVQAQGAAAWVLPEYIENLELIGSSVHGYGNSLDNYITGNDLGNVLNGYAGADTLKGGFGNDTYYIEANDIIEELAGQGTDRIVVGYDYVLRTNFEDLTLTGSAINGTGNSVDNAILGNTSNNVLTGLAGNDTLDGSAGADTLTGGTGNDIYVLDVTGDVVTEAANEGTDTIRAYLSYTLGSNLENLTLIGLSAINGIGNELDNVIVGSEANNVLNGNGGLDTLQGGLGNDTYYLTDTTDIVIEYANQGADTVVSYLYSYTLTTDVENLSLAGSAVYGVGNNLNNSITGNAESNGLYGGWGNDTLNGAGGWDTLYGGAGDDLYIYTAYTGTIVENAGEGFDTVYMYDNYGQQFMYNVEVIYILGYSLTAWGDNLNNTIYGGTGNDTILGGHGSDILVGGVGADYMQGSHGDDIYYVDNVSDYAQEYDPAVEGGSGYDTIYSSVNWTLDYYIERLILIDAAVYGYGNERANTIIGNAYANRLYGYEGSDTIDGGAGADYMKGHTGNDKYYVDTRSDQVVEYASEGTDTVYTSVSYTLPANVENGVLIGSFASITGGAGANIIESQGKGNTLEGGAGDDTLVAGSGDEVLTGGAGSDVFKLNSSSTLRFSGASAVILDFKEGQDKIMISSGDALSSSRSAPPDVMLDMSPREMRATVLYDSNTGILSYDEDGVGSGAAIQLAVLKTKDKLAASDFIFI
jgi:Ca2+-binding RTX toxin-like protein